MTEHISIQFDPTREEYKTIRKSLSVGSTPTRGGNDVVFLLKDHINLLSISGDELLKRFETSWASNDFNQASSLNLLQKSIDLVRNATNDQKIPLQAFLGVAYMIVTDDVKMRVEMRDDWEKLTEKILTEGIEALKQGYEGSELSMINPENFDNEVIGSLAKNLGDKFEKGKKIAWLLTK
jgi:hypothetical protein